MLLLFLILQRYSNASYPHEFQPANLAGLTKNYSTTISFDSKPNLTTIDVNDLNWDYFDVYARYGYAGHADYRFIRSLQRSSVYFVLLFNSKVHYDNYVSGQIEGGLEVATLTRGLGLHVHLLEPTTSFIITSN